MPAPRSALPAGRESSREGTNGVRVLRRRDRIAWPYSHHAMRKIPSQTVPFLHLTDFGAPSRISSSLSRIQSASGFGRGRSIGSSRALCSAAASASTTAGDFACCEARMWPASMSRAFSSRVSSTRGSDSAIDSNSSAALLPATVFGSHWLGVALAVAPFRSPRDRQSAWSSFGLPAEWRAPERYATIRLTVVSRNVLPPLSCNARSATPSGVSSCLVSAFLPNSAGRAERLSATPRRDRLREVRAAWFPLGHRCAPPARTGTAPAFTARGAFLAGYRSGLSFSSLCRCCGELQLRQRGPVV